jgi:hypothetical protein
VKIEVLRNGEQVRLEAVAIERPPKETVPNP